MTDTMRGWKFLAGDGCTYYDNKPFAYHLPGPGEKWGKWTQAPNAFRGTDPIGDCGPGRLHVMCRFSAAYAPNGWTAWRAEGRGIVSASDEKFGARKVRLRRVTRPVLWRYLRRFGRQVNLSGADLRWADLREASLYWANLHEADLREANLRWADLFEADLCEANLRGADLREAILHWADLSGADLSGADLSGADLSGADLRGADLREAILCEANTTNTLGLEDK